MNKGLHYRRIYRDLNSSYARRYLHKFGRGIGFSAEFIHLLKAVAFCLDRSIQFCLQETLQPNGFAVERGWVDYFEPLFPEVAVAVGGNLNRTSFPLGRVPILRELSRHWLRRASNCDFFIFDEVGSRPPAVLHFPELGLGEDYWLNMQTIARMLWAYNPATAEAVSRLPSPACVNSQYIAVHIRRGDKRTETEYIPIESYVEAIKRISGDMRDIYVATDDVRVVDRLNDALGGAFDLHSAQDDVKTGYDQRKFNTAPTSLRRDLTCRFFSELDVLFSSAIFLGTPTSNVYCLVQYMRADKDMMEIKL